MARKKQKQNKMGMMIGLSVLVVALVVGVYGLQTYQSFVPRAKKSGGLTGAGSPSGPHYNLNIIGVSKQKTADMNGGGSRIFVPLEGKARINLSEGDDYYVIDPNGTDGKAEFQLPSPDPDNDGVTAYSVWARAKGKPGGWSKTTTCAVDEYAQEWCSTYSMVLVREKGGSKFTDVSKQLLYVYADIEGEDIDGDGIPDPDGELERYPLFDEALEGYFWDYDNNGLKLVQLRFYEVSSDVN